MVSMKMDTTSRETVNQSEVFFLFANCPVKSGGGGEGEEKSFELQKLQNEYKIIDHFHLLNSSVVNPLLFSH